MWFYYEKNIQVISLVVRYFQYSPFFYDTDSPPYSGLDVQSLLKMLHFGDEVVSSKLATGASTFVVAYGVHKVFAPVRIAITLTCTPFIVRYLRSVGILKLAKSTKPWSNNWLTLVCIHTQGICFTLGRGEVEWVQAGWVICAQYMCQSLWFSLKRVSLLLLIASWHVWSLKKHDTWNIQTSGMVWMR